MEENQGVTSRYPALSLSDARKAAGEALQAVHKGEDPALEKQRKSAAQPSTFNELANEFLERYAKPKKRSWKNDERILRLHVSRDWMHRNVGSIKRADVVALIDRIEANGQVHLARQVLVLIRKIFNWAVEKSLADSNPAIGVRLSMSPLDRSRTLSDDELRRLWSAWDQVEFTWAAYFKVLLLTALIRDDAVAGERQSLVAAGG